MKKKEKVNKVTVSFGSTTEIKRHSYGGIDMYEVTESDLQLLEKESDADIFLNLAIAALSVFVSFLCSLSTCEIPDDTIASLFDGACIASFAFLVVFSLMWRAKSKNKKNIVDKIRSQKIQR